MENELDFTPIPEVRATASQEDWRDTLNAVVRAINARGNQGDMTDDMVRDLRTAVQQLQGKIEERRPEDFSRSEREMVGRYLRAQPDGSVIPCLTRQRIKVGARSFEVPGFLDDVSDGLPEIQIEIQRLYEQRFIIRTIKSAGGRRPSRDCTAITDAEIRRLVGLLPPDLKRAFTDNAGEGAEWIPTETLPTIVRAAEWQRRVAAFFEVISLNSADAKLPRQESGAIPYLISERASDDPAKIPSSSPVTADSTLTPVTMAARVKVSVNASEDTLISLMSVIRADLVQSLVAGEEDAILNGDTTATHQDDIANWNPNGYYGSNFLSTAGGANDHRRAFKGLRRRAADVSNTINRASLDFAKLLTDQAQLVGQPGPNGTISIASPQAIGVIAALDQFATIDVVGPAMAANVRGLAMGSAGGMPLIASEFATDDLNASGVYDNVTTNKGSNTLVRTGRFRIFDRRQAIIQQAIDIATQMIELVITRRFIFAPIGSSTEKNVRYQFNIA